jgi:tetratricopeptide (TPR) repeat protein
MTHALSAHIALLARDYRAGLEFARQATAVGPTFWIGYYQLAWAYERLGHVDLALAALNDAEASSGGNSKMVSLRGYILGAASRRPEAELVLSTLEAIAHERYVPPYAIALVHAGLGHRDRAVDWLRHAYDVRDVHLIWLPMDSKWDAFRADASFLRLLGRCGFGGNAVATQ